RRCRRRNRLQRARRGGARRLHHRLRQLAERAHRADREAGADRAAALRSARQRRRRPGELRGARRHEAEESGRAGGLREGESRRRRAAPQGLAAEARERLVKALAQVAADPEFQQKSIQYYAPLRYLAPAQFEAALREGDAQFRQLWKDSPWAEK